MSKKALFPVIVGLVAIIVVLILIFLKEPGAKWDIGGFTEFEFTNTIGIELVRIEPGSFQMGQSGPLTDYNLLRHYTFRRDADGNRLFGDPTDVLAGWDEQPVMEVTISRPFYMGATEVTLGQFRQFRPGHQPDRRDDEAASGLSWHDAVAFCEWLSEKEDKPYRLPTEAEWEYACRAGTTTIFNTGDRLPDGYLDWFDGETFTGYGLYAALSYDEGKSWPVRRLITPGGEKRHVNSTNQSMFTLSDTYAEFRGYLSATQARDGRVHLVSSKNHHVFNLAWLKQLPSDPKCDLWKPNPR